jgi:hypothetical protein
MINTLCTPGLSPETGERQALPLLEQLYSDSSPAPHLEGDAAETVLRGAVVTAKLAPGAYSIALQANDEAP